MTRRETQAARLNEIMDQLKPEDLQKLISKGLELLAQQGEN